jgi:hypothetical protein
MSSFSQFESAEVDIDYDEILNELGLVEPNYEILNELGPFGLEMSEISHSMFNGLVNEGFDRKARVVDLKSILERELLPRSPIGNGLYLQTTELKGVYGRFTSGFRHTLEYGKQGNINEKFSTVQIMGLVSDDHGGASKKFSFNIYANGKIRFSGGYIGSNVDPQPDAIRRFIIDSYTDKQEFLYNPIALNNTSCQFQFNGHVKCMGNLALQCCDGKHDVESVVYEPELNPNARINLKGGVKISITRTGNVQILGVSNSSRLTDACAIAQNFLYSIYRDTELLVIEDFTKKAKKGKKTKITPKSRLIDVAKKLGVVNFRIKKGKYTQNAQKSEILKMISEKLLKGKKRLNTT